LPSFWLHHSTKGVLAPTNKVVMNGIKMAIYWSSYLMLKLSPKNDVVVNITKRLWGMVKYQQKLQQNNIVLPVVL
jgi:hypothetical protein